LNKQNNNTKKTKQKKFLKSKRWKTLASLISFVVRLYLYHGLCQVVSEVLWTEFSELSHNFGVSVGAF